jgi:predicted nucleotidyltransferase
MVYTVEELRQIITPIAKKYNIAAVYIFGSYARGDATDSSDVDVLFRREGSAIRGILMGALYEELRETIGKGIDLVTEESLVQHDTESRNPWFYESLIRERVQIYGQS